MDVMYDVDVLFDSVFFLGNYRTAFLRRGGDDGRIRGREFASFARGLFYGRITTDRVDLRCALGRPRTCKVSGTSATCKAVRASDARVGATTRGVRRTLCTFSCRGLGMGGGVACSLLGRCLEDLERRTSCLCCRRPLGAIGKMRARVPVMLSRCRFCSEASIRTCLSILDRAESCFRRVVTFRERGTSGKLFLSSRVTSRILRRYGTFLTVKGKGCLCSAFISEVNRLRRLSRGRGDSCVRRGTERVRRRICPTCRSLVRTIGRLGKGKAGRGKLYCFPRKEGCCR